MKNEALVHIANKLVACSDDILKANQMDIAKAKDNGIHDGMIDRLSLSISRIEAMAEGLKQIADLPDYVGEVTEEFSHKNGMKIRKVRVPLGVIGIIFESRPNVTADAFGLCFKSGNSVILKGGKEAIHSNIAITNVIREGLKEKNMNENAVIFESELYRTLWRFDSVFLVVAVLNIVKLTGKNLDVLIEETPSFYIKSNCININ